MVNGSRSVAHDLPWLTERLDQHVDVLCARARVVSEGQTQAGRPRTIGAGRQARTGGNSVHPRPEVPDSLNGRQKRRALYKNVQATYANDRTEAAKLVLSGNWAVRAGKLEASAVFPFWSNLFSMSSPDDKRPVKEPSDPKWECMAPIRIPELDSTISTSTSSVAGPDGLSFTCMKSVPRVIMAKSYNLWLVCSYLPKPLRVNRTVLIPKVPQPATPKDFRPLTIASHWVRVMHKVLARRIQRLCPINIRQKAFLPVDGCQENMAVLGSLIDKATSCRGDCNLAFLDMAKAFDSVGHPSLVRAMIRKGVPAPLRDFVVSGYQNCTTSLMCGGERSGEVVMTRGVKQGDPLSPVLFNMVLDESVCMVEGLSPSVDIGGVRINTMAFADDLVLAATTGAGLQLLVTEITSHLAATGLTVNPSKCKTLSIASNKHEKKWFILTDPVVSIGGRWLPTLGPLETYEYLGIQVGGKGRLSTPGSLLENGLEQLTRAPLKPQQRVYLLINHLIPRLMHVLVLGKVYRTALSRMDRRVRVALRKWVGLPHDTPDAIIYAEVDRGGLGIPELSTAVRFSKQVRLDKKLL